MTRGTVFRPCNYIYSIGNKQTFFGLVGIDKSRDVPVPGVAKSREFACANTKAEIFF